MVGAPKFVAIDKTATRPPLVLKIDSNKKAYIMPNLTTTTTECLGIKFKVNNVPADIETYDSQAGKVGAALESAISNDLYRGVNPDGRDLVVQMVLALTGVKRKVKTVSSPTKAEPNREIETPDESESVYVKRALSQSGKTLAEVQVAIDALPDEDEKDAEGKVIKAGKLLDFNAPKRVAGEKKPNKTDLAFATQLLGLEAGVLAQAVAALKNRNPGLEVEEDPEGKPTAESLAWAIKADRDRVAQEQKNSLLAFLPPAA